MSDHPTPQHDSDELGRLVDARLDGLITDEEHERLAALLRSDPANARAFARRAVMHHRLRELMEIEQDSLLLSSLHLDDDDQLDLIASLDDTNLEQKLIDITDELRAKKQSQQKQAGRRVGVDSEAVDDKPPVVFVIPKALVYATVIGAAALVAIFVYPYLSPSGSAKPAVSDRPPTDTPGAPEQAAPAIVATLTQSYRPVWADDSAQPVIGERMAAGSYELVGGAVTLGFDRGATALVQAPARFELVSDNLGRIELGRITANVPPQAVGFTIETPTSRVVDYGTEFGVVVDDSGQTLAAVFSGLVELSERATEQNPEPAKIPLRAGAQASVDAETGRIGLAEPLDHAHVFARDLADVRYRPRIEGRAEYLRQTPASLAMGQLIDDKLMRVVRERTGVVLSREIDAALTRPGRYTGAGLRNKAEPVAAGLRVDSFLVHFDPGTTPDARADDVPTATATLTFSRPVVAVIVDGNLLYETDAVCALPLLDLPLRSDFKNLADHYNAGNGRGIEVSNADDAIEISEDRTRVTLTLAASMIDQVRVLIEPAD